jgi:hypothetical protein
MTETTQADDDDDDDDDDFDDDYDDDDYPTTSSIYPLPILHRRIAPMFLLLKGSSPGAEWPDHHHYQHADVYGSSTD